MTRNEEVVEKAAETMAGQSLRTLFPQARERYLSFARRLQKSGLLSSPSKERDAKLGRMVRRMKPHARLKRMPFYWLLIEVESCEGMGDSEILFRGKTPYEALSKSRGER